MNRNNFLQKMVVAICGTGLLMVSGCAQAQLGEKLPLGTVGAYSQSTVPWSVINKVNGQGIAIQEYINTGGVIFAVAWNGPAKPDLKTLLGAYFKDFPVTIGARVQAGGSGDLVIYSAGSMPYFKGYAFLKSLAPAGFKFPQ